MSEVKFKDWKVVGTEVDPDASIDGLDPTVAAAVDVLKTSLSSIATYNLVIAHEVMSLGIPVFTTEIPTMAVTVGGDGIVRLLLNPEFLVEFGPTNTAFGLAHEVEHVVMSHLVPDSALGSDEAGTYAKEVVINHLVSKMLRTGIPAKDGKPLIVDPKRTYKEYEKAKKAASTPAVTYEEFVETDIACASYLRELPKPPNPSGMSLCVRANGDPIPGQGGGGGDDGDQNGGGHTSGIDPEQAGRIVDDILGQVMTRAMRGDESAKQTLLDLGDRLGEDHPLWGNLGLAALRGDTPPPVEVTFWEQYLRGALASVLAPGCRLVYPKKLLGFEELYEEEGFRLPFAPIGDDRQTRLGIAVDTSGSMNSALLDRVASLVGNIPDCETEWCAFDAEVYPFEPGYSMLGGGGTSFKVVQEWAESRDDDPFDCILVVTDGYAPAITPAEPDKWVWLITPNGNEWPADHGMHTVIADFKV